MPLGRPPKPTALRILNGMAGHRPINDKEPKVAAGMPGMPKHLSSEACEEWNRVSGILVTSGILTPIDAGALAAYCQAYGRWVQIEGEIADMAARYPETKGLIVFSAKGNPIANPLIGAANVAMRDMLRFAVEFGMTPSARSRIKATDAIGESENPFIALSHT